MPLGKYCLLSLKRTTSVADIQDQLKAENITPLIVARAVEWMHLPMKTDSMLAVDWDLALALESDTQLPASITGLLDGLYQVDVDITSGSLSNETLKSTMQLPPPSFIDRPLRGLCTQFHSTAPSLLAFVDSPLCPQGPVSMLNFVSYQPTPSAAESYKKYLDGVQAGPAKRSGVRTKFNGVVTPRGMGVAQEKWDLVFMAQYPSFKHFVAMGSDPEYQELNQKYRIPVLRDLCILMTTEVDLEWTIPGSHKVKPEVTHFSMSSDQ